MIIGIYPGSFDPITNGHLDIIKRSLGFVDKLIIGVLNNVSKKSLFTIEEKIDMLNFVINDLEVKNIEVEAFSGLLAEYAKLKGANYIVRGIRNSLDFEYEFQMANINRKINSKVDTIFLNASDENIYISSSAVKEIAMYNGDITKYVPNYVAKKLSYKFKSDSR